MGKRKSGSKATSKRGPRDEPDDDEFVKDEVDDFMAQRQVIPLAEGTRRKRSAEEELLENEVLGFEDDDEDEEDEEDEEEGDFEDDDGELGSDFEQEEGEEDEDIGDRWGKRKRTYYNTDYVDSEIVSSDDEAKEEEEEVLLMQKKKRKEQNDDEFLDTFGAMLSGKTSKTATPSKASASKKESNVEAAEEKVERLSKDIQSLSSREKLEILVNDSPELLKLLETFREKVVELKEQVEPVVRVAQAAALPQSEGMSYLEVKYHLLLSYCINICFYLLRKAEGKSVKDHPVIGQLVRIRTVLEKLRPLDKKLKYQVEKLLKMSTAAGAASGSEASEAAANSSAALEAIDSRLAHKADLSAFGGDEGEGEEGEGVAPAGSGKYVIPKRDALAYEEEKEKAAKTKAKELLRAKRSKVTKLLMEEFGDKPEEENFTRVTGKSAMDEVDKEEEELRRFEEENFVRLDNKRLELEKKKKKKGKKHPEFYDDLTDFGDFSVLSSLKQGADDDDEEAAAPKGGRAKRSFEAMLQAADSGKQKLHQGTDDDALLPKKKKARVESTPVAMSGDLSDEDFGDASSFGGGKKGKRDEDDMDIGDEAIEEDDYYKQVEAQQREDKANRAAARSNSGGDDGDDDGEDNGEEGGEGGKRGITYEMAKNKGTSKRSKKSVRNPRVKRKVQYEKAVKKRASQVQKPRDQSQRYSGESTGIKTHTVKSRQF